MDALGVQIIEGDHPGSSYYAAELRQGIDYANQIARDSGSADFCGVSLSRFGSYQLTLNDIASFCF